MAASTACAAALGMGAQSPEVIAVGYSVRVLLQPAQLVSRVITDGQVLRGAPLPWLRREVQVATFLAATGAAVVPPFDAPGPHLAEGLDVTLWRWLEPAPGLVSQRQFATLLFRLHEQLSDYHAELPVVVGPLTDIESALRVSDDQVLHAAAAQLLPEAQGWPRRPLHGDRVTSGLTSRTHAWGQWSGTSRRERSPTKRSQRIQVISTPTSFNDAVNYAVCRSSLPFSPLLSTLKATPYAWNYARCWLRTSANTSPAKLRRNNGGTREVPRPYPAVTA